jgi:hypothetical protein
MRDLGTKSNEQVKIFKKSFPNLIYWFYVILNIGPWGISVAIKDIVKYNHPIRTQLVAC